MARDGAWLWVFGGSPHANGGAGLQVEAGGSAQLRSSTVSGNGSGIDNAGSVYVGLSTITANAGSGIAGSGTTAVTGSIVANQTGGADCASAVSSLGWNAFGEAGCGVGANDTLSPALVLTPELVDEVPGFVPGAGAADVRDVIPAGVGPCQSGFIELDQHFTARPVGAGCDKGALETAAPSSSFVVDTDVDAFDAAPGDGVCDDGTGACTLRGAIQEANTLSGGAPETITIAPGVNPVVAPQNVPGTGLIPEPLTIAGGLIIDGGGATINLSHRQKAFVVESLDTTFRDVSLAGVDVDIQIASGTAGGSPALTLDHVSMSGPYSHG